METGANQMLGTTYVHEGPGDFYVNVNVANAEAYTVVVEYDEESASQGGFGVEAVVLLAATVGAVIVGALFYFLRFGRRKSKMSFRARHGGKVR
jgi:hypothetical protein